MIKIIQFNWLMVIYYSTRSKYQDWETKKAFVQEFEPETPYKTIHCSEYCWFRHWACRENISPRVLLHTFFKRCYQQTSYSFKRIIPIHYFSNISANTLNMLFAYECGVLRLYASSGVGLMRSEIQILICSILGRYVSICNYVVALNVRFLNQLYLQQNQGESD